jgi:hypothetical protein
MKKVPFKHDMIEVHLYGRLRSLVPDSKANEDIILMCEYKQNETFETFITRLGLQLDDIGDCFINGTLARVSDYLADGDRVGLFPFNMKLIDGGMHLKFHPQRR